MTFARLHLASQSAAIGILSFVTTVALILAHAGATIA